MLRPSELMALRERPLGVLFGEVAVEEQNWEGILWGSQVPKKPVTDAEMAGSTARDPHFPPDWILNRLTKGHLRESRQMVCVVWGTLLGTNDRTPFLLHGQHYVSVSAFFHSLKVPPDDALRRQIAEGVAEPPKKIRRDGILYRGRQVAVSSWQHRQILAEAIEAKVHQNPDVQEALRATGSAKLVLNRWGTFSSSSILGWVNLMSMMVLRWQRFRPAL